ncbi:MAG: flagellar basal body rod protein FlgB [Pirellula sp.]|jgi:flagellar basal-body rod protein FlgB|nr:flagellar basal body rod protein FlgB [Pirellula sp.]
MFTPSTTKALEETIAFAERRHAILAGNIANMDTPGYKSRDLSVQEFRSSLKEMMEAERKPQAVPSPGESSAVRINDRERTSLTREQAMKEVHDASTQILYHDGSNDNLETQITEIAKNQTMHSTAVALLKSQYRTLQMAIAGNVTV